MTELQILLCFSNDETSLQIEQEILQPAGYRVRQVKQAQEIHSICQENPPDIVILEYGPNLDVFDLSARLLEEFPAISMILFNQDYSESLVVKALRLGFVEYLYPPLQRERVLKCVQRAIHRHQNLEKYIRQQARRDTKSLQQRIQDLETLQRIGRTITASLDLDSVLAAVIEAAVELSGAEEGSLLLLDDASGELYMRAAKNIHEEFVRTFRLPVQDTLLGQVLSNAQPVILNEQSPKKIKTHFLVRSLMYVPIILNSRAVGVLGVENRESNRVFSEYEQALLSALADYASIAINNAHYYFKTEYERQKLETILTRVKDGVIVMDPDQCLLLVNQTARQAFHINSNDITAKSISQVIQNADLQEILKYKEISGVKRGEINLEDGRVFNAQVTVIPDVGQVVTMQDITHLKKLDRIKTDFVNTVSHDLRSPLTAVLGYAELIGRIGPVNPKQQEFIKRIQASVQNITALINDLLDLGRIEAGLDIRKEAISLPDIMRNSIEGLATALSEKNHRLEPVMPEAMPPIQGNPIRLQQMLVNLISNAIKYTPQGGRIAVRLSAENGQTILQVSDTGPGIPPSDQPYIFDKFFRSSNQPPDATGTGLGLAIVKSIVEDHQGRIWVDSILGKGSTFTVVLPST